LEADIGQLIAAVQPGSIADELGIQPGDRLVSIDEQPVRDVFDYQTRQSAEQLLVTIRKSDGEIQLLDIEKDEDEDLGIDFANPMLDDCRNCHNRCVFCFIDQLPEGMRPSLYLKDDDLRLSFLSGNYVTLTNITSDELDRIIEYRFSPLNISVHATDPDIRRKMMRNRHAGNLMPALRRIADAGIRINAQIVLVPDYNDGDVLERTITDLAGLLPAVQSVAVVPVGITRYRAQNKLVPLRSVGQADAQAILDTIERWQRAFLEKWHSRILYAADEFYLNAGRPFPPAEAYEDYPQLENGVGMCALFQAELSQGIRDRREQKNLSARKARSDEQARLAGHPERIWLITGKAAEPILKDAAERLSACYGRKIEALPVSNQFFGETITVAGLLTGQDIQSAIEEKLAQIDPSEQAGHADEQSIPSSGPVVIVPENQLRAGTRIFLDDETVDGLSRKTGIPVLTTPPDADSLLRLLDSLTELDLQNSPFKKGDVPS